MDAQLRLLSTPAPTRRRSARSVTDVDPGPTRPESWRLDERTRDVGREGVARARAALQARRRQTRDDDRASAA